MTTPRQGRKRGRDGEVGGSSALESAYKDLVFTPIESTGKPGTPHSFFSESFQVSQRRREGNDLATDSEGAHQVLHKHANGLVIVTAGNMLSRYKNSEVSSFQLNVEESPAAAANAGARRKLQAKMLKGKKVEGTIRPKDVIASVRGGRDGEEVIALHSYVWGTVMEVNPVLMADTKKQEEQVNDKSIPKILLEDPLLDGYICVVLPSGRFPPDSQGGDSAMVEATGDP